MTIDIVIASYKEKLDWLHLIPPHWRVFLYNVDDARTEFPIPCTKLPNGGREAGPWLYHLEKEHGNYADVTLFVQGRPFDHEAHELLRVMHKDDFPHQLCYINGRPAKRGDMAIRPHGDIELYLRKGWGDLRIPPPICFSCGAQFYVKRQIIMARPMDHYARLRENCFDKTIHSFGHRMEPCWACIFDWEPFC